MTFAIQACIFIVKGERQVWGGGGGLGEGNTPSWYSSGVFLEFQYLRVSINTFLCNTTFGYSESLASYSRGRRQSVEPR